MIFIPSNSGNYSKGRDNHLITRGYFHRTAVKGDTAIGEANYFHNNCVQASFYKVIDLDGIVVESVLPTDTAWAVNEWDENEISLSYEFTGLNGTPLTAKQISAVIADIKSDAATKKIANHRLLIAEIKPRKVSGWGNHADVTKAYSIAGGHTDGISEKEIAQILAGIK
jgi:hypothetical protein